MRRNPGSLEHGSIVGRFEIIRKIAVGGMGIVYEARDTELGRVVALKHPRLDVGVPETNRRRFLREARAASGLLHPNIVPIFEVFEAGGLPWIAMEMIEGESLRERMKRPDPMPIEEILRYAEGLASALAEAHRKGILHRDLKPENVLIDSRGQARLMDFGLAHTIVADDRENDETVTRVTGQGLVVGTPGYLSPEQALGRPVDARSDIFCLGLILYELCAGHSAFKSKESDSWLDGLLYSMPELLPADREDLPEALKDILSKALAKDPSQRYQDAESMRKDLGRLHSRVEAGLARKVERGLRRRRRLNFGLGLGALMVAAVALYWFGTGEWFLREPTSLWVAHPLTHDPVWAGEPALSPDESLIAHVSGRSGCGDVWLIDRAGGNPLQLTKYEGADRRPTWTPDGAEIYFSSFRGGIPSIWRIPRFGGTAELVISDADDPALSPDGRRVAFVRSDENGHWRVAIAPLDDVKHAHFLTEAKLGFWFHRRPRFSPDGKMIIFQTPRSLWLVPTAGGEPQRLTSVSRSLQWPEWSGRSIFFSEYIFGTNSLWRIKSPDGRARRLTTGAGGETQVAPCADGRSLIYSTFRVETELRLLDLSAGTEVRLGEARNPDEPSISPDGMALVFIASYRDESGLFLQQLQAGRPLGQPKLLFVDREGLANPVIGPDRRWVAFHRVLNGQRDIWIISTEGGDPIQFTNDPAADTCPFFSPDGRYLVFASNRNGVSHIWGAPVVEGYRAGNPEQLSFGETTDFQPRISPDGSKLAWLGNRNGEEEVWIRSLNGSNEARALTQGVNIRALWWGAGSRSLLTSVDSNTQPPRLMRVSVPDGLMQRVRYPVDFGVSGIGNRDLNTEAISLGGNGHFLVYTRAVAKGDLWSLQVDSVQ